MFAILTDTFYELDHRARMSLKIFLYQGVPLRLTFGFLSYFEYVLTHEVADGWWNVQNEIQTVHLKECLGLE